jgi:hypothetical protein
VSIGEYSTEHNSCVSVVYLGLFLVKIVYRIGFKLKSPRTLVIFRQFGSSAVKNQNNKKISYRDFISKLPLK